MSADAGDRVIGHADFIKCNGSINTGEYPRFSANHEGTQLRHFENVKFTLDITQSIVMPEFDGWELANIVQFWKPLSDDTLESVGYWWIVSARRSSISDGAIQFDLSYNAPSSMIGLGMGLKGFWQALPTQSSRVLRATPVSGEMQIFNDTKLPSMGNHAIQGDETHRIGWLSWTMIKAVNTFVGYGCQYHGATTAYDSNVITASDAAGYNTYGCPIALDEFRTPNVAAHVILAFTFNDTTKTYTAPPNTDVLKGAVRIVSEHDDYNTVTTYVTAPTIGDLMNNPANVGMSGEGSTANLIDISVSWDCPFHYRMVHVDSDDMPEGAPTMPGDVFYLYPDSTSYTQNKDSIPFVSHLPNGTDSGNTPLAYYLIQGYTGNTGGEHTEMLESMIPAYRSSTMQLTTSNLYNQSIMLHDYTGQSVSEIPQDEFVDSDTITVTVNLKVDYNGMYRELLFPHGTYITITEPHLPSTTDTWRDYQSAAMKDDRNAVLVNIGLSAASTAMGAATGGIGLAMSAGTSIAQGVVTGASQSAMQSTAMGLNNQAAQYGLAQVNAGGNNIIGAIGGIYNQHMKERAMKRAPNQAINAGYGINQLMKALENAPGIYFMRPAGFTSQKLTDYTGRFGYPAETLEQVTMQDEGYYQGIIYPNASAGLCGPRFELLNACFNNGVYFRYAS